MLLSDNPPNVQFVGLSSLQRHFTAAFGYALIRLLTPTVVALNPWTPKTLNPNREARGRAAMAEVWCGATRTLWERTDIRRPGNLGHEEEEEGLMGDRKEAGPKKVAAECCTVKEQWRSCVLLGAVGEATWQCGCGVAACRDCCCGYGFRARER
jgi:hypothetical protein